jgi:hypothetical protein
MPKSVNVQLLLGLFGLVLFIVVAFFAVLHLTHGSAPGDTPSDADQPQADQIRNGDQPPPDVTLKSSPPPPEKKPALGQ